MGLSERYRRYLSQTRDFGRPEPEFLPTFPGLVSLWASKMREVERGFSEKQDFPNVSPPTYRTEYCGDK